MNVSKRLSLSDEAISNFIDPRTGTRLRPLGVVGGRTIWPIMGGSEEEDSAGGGATDDDDDKNPEDDEDSSKDSEKDAEKGDPNAKITALEEEKSRQYKRRKEAETRAEKAERELAELKAKDTPEQERIVKENETLKSENETLQQTIRDRTLENAFLKDNTYSWHNPGRALSLADLSNVEIDDDGKVHGLKAALDALAKSDSYLIKNEESKDKSDKDDDDKVSTGDPKNQSRKEKSKSSAETRQKALHEKYPALRR